MSYSPPISIWEVGNQIQFDEPLEADDPRFVDTNSARGQSFNYKSLLRPLGIDHNTLQLKMRPRDKLYILFCGHRGCGKSTELRRLTAKLNKPDKFFVLFLDALKELDIHNLEYTDVLLALAQQLLAQLVEKNIAIDAIFYQRLENWFQQRIESHETTKTFATEVKAGAQAEVGLPFLAKVFTGIINAFKFNATYKEELRRITKNHFKEFAEALNQLIREAEQRVQETQQGQKLLFVVDGTDRLNQEDSRRFFIQDAYQLQEIQGAFIYCTPIHLIYEQGQIGQVFINIFKLPMIQLATRDNEAQLLDSGYAVMRQLLFQRADPSLFDTLETVDRLIQYSGGHPRDLLRLLMYAFNYAEGERFDRSAVEQAIQALATDYRRLLNIEDYQLLYDIDQAPEKSHNKSITRKLLYDLAVLEYNSYYWKSHPVIRTLPSYQTIVQGNAYY